MKDENTPITPAIVSEDGNTLFGSQIPAAIVSFQNMTDEDAIKAFDEFMANLSPLHRYFTRIVFMSGTHRVLNYEEDQSNRDEVMFFVKNRHTLDDLAQCDYNHEPNKD